MIEAAHQWPFASPAEKRLRQVVHANEADSIDCPWVVGKASEASLFHRDIAPKPSRMDGSRSAVNQRVSGRHWGHITKRSSMNSLKSGYWSASVATNLFAPQKRQFMHPLTSECSSFSSPQLAPVAIDLEHNGSARICIKDLAFRAGADGLRMAMPPPQ